MYELLSLDGVAERPDGFFADWDEAMDANLAAVIETQDAVIDGLPPIQLESIRSEISPTGSLLVDYRVTR